MTGADSVPPLFRKHQKAESGASSPTIISGNPSPFTSGVMMWFMKTSVLGPVVPDENAG